MPSFTFAQSGIAAGATFLPLTGWQYEYLPWPAHVKLLAWSDRAGTCKLSIYSGSEAIQEESPVAAGAAAGTLPSEYQVHPVEFVAPAGDRLKLLFRNTDAAAGIVNGVIIVNPVG